MILDGHAHISRESYSSVEKLFELMNAARIDQTVLVPGGTVDVRRMTNYVIGKEKPVAMEPPNDYVLELVKKYPDKFYGFCNINPNQSENDALGALQGWFDQGMSGLKLSPMVHQFSLLGKVSKSLADLCGQLGIPYYTHTMFQASASTASVAKLAAEFPKTTFIIGHLGFGPCDVEAIETAESKDNVYLETSTANFLAIEQAVERCGYEKVIFGSEYPLSNPRVERAKIDVLNIPDNQKEYIMGKNMLNLLQASVKVV
ncbi:amidohydrolase family protein [Paenibacillus sp. NEAU-GSW1]|uniref:amidohydrolase family protein n=1 Tax=Paenibacillus sp. NEAU-GSW1 TaxID=2682486 RepID=UPI0012E30849|nr:amidohydrolase family protein [Paenibacillus sp. NEAU-GSW1]MUT64891.1 amidohydrolase family protein [Paenibacillus sp. NEAU-GSW1]